MNPTLEEIKKVAIERGCHITTFGEGVVLSFLPDELQDFAHHYKEEGRKEQREIDLKLCRAQSDKYWKFKGTKDWSGYVEGMSDGADEREESIRNNTGE